MTEYRVDAPVGTIVGRVDGGVRRFLGVPFAEAPVGALRFAAPVPRPPFTEPFEALAYGGTAQQFSPFAAPTIPEPSITGDDILTLNVFTPELGYDRMPVLVYVHGGGYVAGSPASPWYDGRGFALDGIVLVTVGYRLGVEGFGLVEDGPANLGLRDVLLALEWVQRNIAAFGGDAGCVTLAGQSAGAGVVLALLASPLARGLVHRAVSLSGIDRSFAPEDAARTVERVAAHVGVPPTRAALAAVTRETLQRALFTLADDVLACGPVAGDDVVPVSIAEGLAVHGLDVPLLIGATGDEFEADPAAATGTREEGTRATDVLFRSVVPRTASARAGADTWVYSFEWVTPVTGGATHCADVPFFFDALDAEGVPEALGAEPPQALATNMHADLVQFAIEGRLDWPTSHGLRGDATRRYSADGVDAREIVMDSYDPVIPGGR